MRSFLLLIVSFLIALHLFPNLSSNLLSELNDNIPQPVINYHPDPSIVTLADQSTMTDKAKQIFYAASPEIDTDRNVFETHCKAPVTKNTVELGCYTSNNKIYILNITNSQLTSQMVVIASHEMLHAAYAQLSDSDKQKVNNEIESELPKIQNKALTEEIQNYKITEPGQRDNELHSILGTEYTPLGSDLDNYYGQYFISRQVVVGDSTKFKNAFTQLENKLSSLKSQIQQTRVTMSQDLRRRDILGYDNLVLKLNSLVGQYNLTVESYNELSRSLQGEESAVNNP